MDRRHSSSRIPQADRAAFFKSKMSILEALKACSRTKDLKRGKAIHEDVIKSGSDSDMYVASTLVSMYAKCGCMVEARRVFDAMPHHDVVSWNALISGYADNGEGEAVLDLLAAMNCAPDSLTFVAAFKACTSLAAREDSTEVEGELVKVRALDKGMAIHAQVSRHLCATNLYVASSLVDMYGKCGCIVRAWEVFQSMQERDSVTWNALILGYADNGKGRTALSLFLQMDLEGFAVNSRAFVAVFKACGVIGVDSMEMAVMLHEEATANKFDSNMYVSNTLVDMYAKCGSTAKSRQVFETMKHHDIVSWNAFILGHADNGEEEMALWLFSEMQSSCAPDSLTFVAALKACTSLATKEAESQVDGKLVKLESLKKGMGVHSRAVSNNLHTNLYVGSALVDMYAKCGSMERAHEAFQKLHRHNVVCWNALVLGYVDNFDGSTALDMFFLMETRGCVPDSRTYVAALKACTVLATKEEGMRCEGRFKKPMALDLGMGVHSRAVRSRCDSNLFVCNTLVDMYAECGDLAKACVVFNRIKHPDVVSWNALISGYADNGEGSLALSLFFRMERQGYEPNALTFVAALKACTVLAQQREGKLAKVEALNQGMVIHSKATEQRLDTDVYVSNNLVDMYGKCGSMVKSREVFDKVQNHDNVCWNSLILGYVDNGDGEEALKMFLRMQSEACVPDSLTYIATLKACSMLGAFEFGKNLHAEMSSRGLDSKATVANSLVDFYGKCCSMADAQQVFDDLAAKDSVSWGTLLAGYSRTGNMSKVFEVFERMRVEFQPNGITFLCVLTTCSHAGLVQKGLDYFELMVSKHGIDPEVEHYNCIIDMLGRANKLGECLKLIDRMPFRPNRVTWMAVLSACSKWKDAETGRLAFDSLLEFEEVDNSGPYVIMSNIYKNELSERAASGGADDQYPVRSSVE